MKVLFFWIVFFSFVLTSFASNTNTNQAEQRTRPDQDSSWDRTYGGADKSYDKELLLLREKIAPRFKKFQFEDKVTGRTMTYNLFIPKDYDKTKSYPLVLFMADASTAGKVYDAPLKQGYGAIIWATDESQAQNPCFVLAPSFAGPERATNDNWQVSDEVSVAFRLLHFVVSQYNIDINRLYTTGQSMGGMISFYFNANYPGLFAASIYVGSQWDVNVLEPLVDMKFFYIVSAADPKASIGMNELAKMLTENGVKFGSTEFSAKISPQEQDKYVQTLLSQGHTINFIKFTRGTVIPEGSHGPGGEHMYSFDYAYKLSAVRDWLFKQSK